MATAWKSGDLVRFVAGGPRMAVKAVQAVGGGNRTVVVCQWFSRDGVLQEGTFTPDVLIEEAGDGAAAGDS